jgi:hypothetical protein
MRTRISRRTFLDQTAFTVAGGTALAAANQPNIDPASPVSSKPLIVSTWPFGKPANEAALAVLEKGGSILDAVEQGIWVTESDPKNPSVGLGGLPNAAGIVQLDACIMLGPGHRAGSVAAIEGIRHPISAARRVMEKTPHVMLVGEAARMFALQEGGRRDSHRCPYTFTNSISALVLCKASHLVSGDTGDCPSSPIEPAFLGNRSNVDTHLFLFGFAASGCARFLLSLCFEKEDGRM